MNPPAELGALFGATDWRRPDRRRAVFHDFYEFHLRHKAHPGCVYGLMPWLRAELGWDDEEALWFAFLNGNTQNPITSLILHRRGPRPEHHADLIAFYRANYGKLAFDTDRRYHKKSLEQAIHGYLAAVGPARGSQAAFWNFHASGGFPEVWEAARRIPTFGRLSAFSYTEYLRVMGIPFDCNDLFLDDTQGSKSHRNGLCKVLGLDQWDWHDSNPDFPGAYPRDFIGYLEGEAATLLAEARVRAAGQPWADDVSYFTLESTLCTYKGWHRVNRRYAGVYWDMHYNRILDAQEAFPGEDLELFWVAREQLLPPYLRLESTPTDPGLSPIKQNHYRLTGEVIVMGHEYPQYWSAFDQAVADGDLGKFR